MYAAPPRHREDVDRRLQAYVERLTPDTLRAAGGDRFPPPPIRACRDDTGGDFDRQDRRALARRVRHRQVPGARRRVAVDDGPRRRPRPLLKCHSGCDSGAVSSRPCDERPLADCACRRPGRGEYRCAVDEKRQQPATFVPSWHQAQPIAGTPAETYLRHRGIIGVLPPTLRYHPALKHTETGLRLPAMVAAVRPRRTAR